MNRDFDFRELEMLVAVAEEGSFTAAARRLGTNQPNVSGGIAALEASLELRLFDRGPRSTELTPTGAALLPAARRILKAREQLKRDAAALGDEPRGNLSIAASTIPAGYLLPPLLVEFRRRAPAVKVRLLAVDSDLALARLRADDAELALVGAPPEEDGLLARPIGSDAIVLVATPELAASIDRDSKTPLADLPLVLREPGSATRRLALDQLDGEVEIALEVHSNDALREAVLSGLGAGFVSKLAVHRELADGSLIALDDIVAPIERRLWLVTKSNRSLSAAAREMIDLLEAQASKRTVPR